MRSNLHLSTMQRMQTHHVQYLNLWAKLSLEARFRLAEMLVYAGRCHRFAFAVQSVPLLLGYISIQDRFY